MVSLVAIALSDGVARPLCHRSAAGWGVKGDLVECAHELRRRHRRRGGRSWAARQAVFGRFQVAALPTLGFLSQWEVRTAASTHNV